MYDFMYIKITGNDIAEGSIVENFPLLGIHWMRAWIL